MTQSWKGCWAFNVKMSKVLGFPGYKAFHQETNALYVKGMLFI